MTGVAGGLAGDTAQTLSHQTQNEGVAGEIEAAGGLVKLGVELDRNLQGERYARLGVGSLFSGTHLKALGIARAAPP